MAISVNWATKVINVPKADTDLIQLTPIEVRELNLNNLRLIFKQIEASSVGMSFKDIHFHNPPLQVGGVTLARVVAVINGYTVTFEDGQYAVNLVGANSNVGDVVNLNQVSIRTANSAGLIQTREIEHSSFNGVVTIDPINGKDGTLYPIGTQRVPVKSLADALLIDNVRGFGIFDIRGDMVIDNGGNYEGLTFRGQSQTKSTLTISDAANVLNSEFEHATIQGVLDGGSRITNCRVRELNYVDGFIQNCVLEGPITLSGNDTAHFLNCWSGTPGVGTPTIDMGASGSALALRNYNGGIRLINKSGPESVSLDINSGQVVLDSTVTNGTIVVRGIGKLTDDSTGTANVLSGDFLSPTSIAAQVWDEQTSLHQEVGSFGEAVLVGLSAEDSARILDIYRILGLDINEPLTVSATSRESGGTTIQQSISVSNGTATVTRLP